MDEVYINLLATLEIPARYSTGLMVIALDSGSSSPGSSPGLGHCVVLLGKTLYMTVLSQCLSPPRKLNGTGDKMPGDKGGVAIVASCYRNRDKLQQCEPVGSCRLYLETLGLKILNNLTW